MADDEPTPPPMPTVTSAADQAGLGAGGSDGDAADPDAPASDAAVDPGDAALFGVIDRLATILDHSDLVELEVQVGQTGLTLRKPAALAQTVAVAVGPGTAAAGDPASGSAGAAVSGGTAGAGGTLAPGADHAPATRPSIKAPLTGIWYGSPAPGSAPYVQVGGEVAVGQVIGLIEAMKLFNEIKSDLAGRVVKVHAEDGKLVKAKQPLIEVEPL
ncbi:MAG TPA: biotin/lipoyl-containing protein [Candidatus Binatus sp.]|nr:biotin/lipoyl-containing protein [Candidatus Binatus sp.]